MSPGTAQAWRSPTGDKPIDLSLFSDGIHHWDIYSPIREYERFDVGDTEGIADQLLRYQNDDGGWPKNIDWLGKLDPDYVKSTLKDHHWESSFDNRNTYSQVRYLAEAYERTGKVSYRDGAVAGLHFILNSQNPSGGWRGADVDAITYNDDVMVGVMSLLYDLSMNRYPFEWIDADLRDSLTHAFDRALEVTLACQIKIDGVLSGWCQQHDHETLLPVKARSYELASITPRESSEVVAFLMSLEVPSNAIKTAIESAVTWFRKAAIVGYAYKQIPIEPRAYYKTTVDFDRIFVEQPDAPLIWARYYDLKKGEPFLCQRSGTVVYDYREISFERRVGYDWYGFWPEKVFALYPAWKQKHP